MYEEHVNLFKMQQLRGSAINSMILGRNHFCCLCFKTVADSAVHIEDKVIVKKHDKTYDEIYVTDILTNIFGPEINDQLSIFNAVCNQCSSEAINSHKFITKCKDNLQKLGHIIDGLTNGTETCLANAIGSKAGFVSINTENFEYKSYNSKTTSYTSLLAYQKFLSLKSRDELTSKPATKTNLTPKYRTPEKRKVLRLRLVRLHPRVSNNHTVFVCPTCDQFFVRRYSMHQHLKRKHNISKEINEAKLQKCLIRSPSTIKTMEEYVNLTSLDDAITSNDSHLHVLKIISDEKEFVDHTLTTNYLDKNKGNFSRRVPLILRHSKKVSKTN